MANLVIFLRTSVPHTFSFSENFVSPYIKKILDLNYINIYPLINIKYENQKKRLPIEFLHLSRKNMIKIYYPRFQFCINLKINI